MTYYAIRFRSTDDLHRRGDILYGGDNALYIGQTPECQLRLAPHPDYADTCYAVIVRREQGNGWVMLRQEAEADIRVNGQPLAIAHPLSHGDTLQLDHTILRFCMEQGQQPATTYVSNKPSWPLRITLSVIVLALLLSIVWQVQTHLGLHYVFRHESPSIYCIEARGLEVYQGDSLLAEEPCEQALVGTAFLTEDGYLVTARHCIEFWLNMEDQLTADTANIPSPAVRWAIRAEEDSTLRLVTLLTLTAPDGRSWDIRSDRFTTDRSHDALYDLGDRQHAYTWRSIISRYEKRDCELGDVALMPWDEKGTIRLADTDRPVRQREEVFSFGYPQGENRQEAHFTIKRGDIDQEPESPDSWFICEMACQPGFSGGPVIADKQRRQVVGLVSRQSGHQTVVIPVSRIHQLIRQIP